MDDSTHPCPAAAFYPPLPRGGLGPQHCTVCVPEIDQTSAAQCRLVALDECRESRHALGEESSAEQRTRARFAELQDVAGLAAEECSLTRRMHAGQMQCHRRRVLGESHVAFDLGEDLDDLSR